MGECQEFAADLSQFVQQYPATLDCLWVYGFSDEARFHLDGLVGSRTRDSGPQEVYTAL
jgi:hypothetical protein